MATTWRQQYFWDEETIRKEAREFSLTDEIMALINSWGWWGWGWGWIAWVKVNNVALVPDAYNFVNVTVPQVVNSLWSNSTTSSLSAAKWKELYEYIQALQHVWHFLALWNTSIWLPVTNPQTSPYTYNTWDYYIVSAVAASGWTNYKPNGASYTINVASTTVETEDVHVNDIYFYDWYEWRLLDNSGSWGSIAIDNTLSTTSTNPVQNAVITQALNNKASLTDLDWKQNVLTEWKWIDITNDVISTNIIYAECTTPFWTRDKECTTALWNYTPARWDVICIVFTQWCGVGSPRFNFDWGNQLISCTVGTWAANATTLWLWMDKIAWLFVYDWTILRTFPVTNTTYSAGTGISIASNTVTNTWVTSINGSTWAVTINDIKTSATAPSNPTAWTAWYDTTNNVLKIYNGTSWDTAGTWWWWGSWWSITGTLSDQTDLQEALDEKLEKPDLAAWDWITISSTWWTAGLPAWYEELEYIEFTWTQYILSWLSWVSSHTYNIKLKMEIDSNLAYADAWIGWNAWWWILMRNYDGVLKYSNGTTSWVIWNAWDILDLSLDITNWTSTYTWTLGWVSWTNSRANSSLNIYTRINYPLWVTTTTNAPYTYGNMFWKLYYFEYTDNNVLWWKYYPAKRVADGVIWMYDTVTDTFFTNQWTGTIVPWPSLWRAVLISVDDTVWTNDNVVAGDGIVITQWASARLPEWYTEVEYIQSDGNSYVDTQVVTTGTDYIENVFQKVWTSTATCAWFGSREGSSLIRFCIWSYYRQQSSAFVYFWWYNVTEPLWWANTNKHTIKFYNDWNSYFYQLDGLWATQYSPQNTSNQPTITSYIFARHWGNWQATTYDNEWTKVFYHLQKTVWWIPKMELIPCVRDSDDEPGFYDLVNERFLTNWWSWTLTAWPVVEFSPATTISVGGGILTPSNVVAGDNITITPIWSSVPSGYTQIAYIALDWTQALDTWITWIWKSVEIDTLCTNASTSSWQILSSYWEDYLWMFFWVVWWNFAIQNNASWKITTVNVSQRNIVTWSYSLSGTYNKIDITAWWTTLSYTRTSNRPDNNITLWWGISTTNTLLYPYSWYIYWARIYDTSTTQDVANYVPCINPDSEVWLYDTVSDTFLRATKWTFAAWPAVTSSWIEISAIMPFDFTNMTFVSRTSNIWTAASSLDIPFPSWAKMAFVSWRAYEWDAVYAAWEVIVPRMSNLLKSSFMWWWNSSSNYISWWIWYNSSDDAINFTGSGVWNVRIAYSIYFYR